MPSLSILKSNTINVVEGLKEVNTITGLHMAVELKLASLHRTNHGGTTSVMSTASDDSYNLTIVRERVDNKLSIITNILNYKNEALVIKLIQLLKKQRKTH
uniref:Uncharacterized protein n=1 Tax=Heterorhabditis bacteriophora TaxID=37862 RepID=A0A1I7WFF3_HETBA